MKKNVDINRGKRILIKLLRVRSRLSAINICPSTRLIRQESNDRQPTLSDQVYAGITDNEQRQLIKVLSDVISNLHHLPERIWTQNPHAQPQFFLRSLANKRLRFALISLIQNLNSPQAHERSTRP